MKGGIKFPASRLQKPERKVIEKNRRNQMKLLYSHLYSLVPPNFKSKGDHRVSDRMDRAIDFIQTLKNNLEMIKGKKEKLLRSLRHTKFNNAFCKSIDIQIQQITHDLDAVLVTGLNSYSSFCDVVRTLDHCSAEVTHATFSSSGYSIFHIRQKQIEAEDVCKRLKNLAAGNPNKEEFGDASFCKEVEKDLSVWDYDVESSVWDYCFQSNVW